MTDIVRFLPSQPLQISVIMTYLVGEPDFPGISGEYGQRPVLTFADKEGWYELALTTNPTEIAAELRELFGCEAEVTSDNPLGTLSQ